MPHRMVSLVGGNLVPSDGSAAEGPTTRDDDTKLHSLPPLSFRASMKQSVQPSFSYPEL